MGCHVAITRGGHQGRCDHFDVDVVEAVNEEIDELHLESFQCSGMDNVDTNRHLNQYHKVMIKKEKI
jgi:hypothetical protein